jgi:DNA transformation protein
MLALMAASKDADFKDFILDQLRDLRGVRARAMFGGFGLYSDDDFFGIVYKGRLYFKTDESSRAAYLERGMKPFRPRARQELERYHEVPVEIAEDATALARWARAAIAVARAEPEKKPRSR